MQNLILEVLRKSRKDQLEYYEKLMLKSLEQERGEQRSYGMYIGADAAFQSFELAIRAFFREDLTDAD